MSSTPIGDGNRFSVRHCEKPKNLEHEPIPLKRIML
jgi:hypothetical protein